MATNHDVRIDQVTEVTDELHTALARLVPQLSTSAPPLTRAALDGVVSSPASTLLVARRRDTVVGSLTLAVFPVPTGLRAWVEDVVVDGTARGEGVGARLMTYALELAAAQGCRSVDLTSRPSRESANRLYRRLGFESRETNVYRYTMPSDA